MRYLLYRVLLYGCFLLFCLWIILPLWFTLSSSVSTGSALAAADVGLWPEDPTLENFQSLLAGTTGSLTEGISTAGSRLPRALLMSSLIATTLVASNILLGGLAGYALSRYRFPGSRIAYTFVLTSRVVPAIAIVVPFFIAFRIAGLIGSPWALIISYHIFTLPLAVLLLKNYFDGLPLEVEEAAKIDGATRLQIVRLIAAPLARPGLTAAALLVFLEAWGEFFYALVLTSQLTLPPLLAGLQSMHQFGWPSLAAGTVIALIPPVALALVFQRYIVSGLAQGTVR